MVSDLDYRRIQIQHFLLVGIYLSLAILSATLPLSERFQTKQPVHFESPKWIDCVNFCHESTSHLNSMDLKSMRQFCADINLKNINFFIEVKYMIFDFRCFFFTIFLWTAFMKLFYVTIYSAKYRDLLSENQCLNLRWLEYVISFGITMSMVAYITGIQNIIILCILFKLCYALCSILYFNQKLPFIGCLLIITIFVWLWIYMTLTLLLSHSFYLYMIPWYIYLIHISQLCFFVTTVTIFVLERFEVYSAVSLETLYNLSSLIGQMSLMFILFFSFFLN